MGVTRSSYSSHPFLCNLACTLSFLNMLASLAAYKVYIQSWFFHRTTEASDWTLSCWLLIISSYYAFRHYYPMYHNSWHCTTLHQVANLCLILIGQVYKPWSSDVRCLCAGNHRGGRTWHHVTVTICTLWLHSKGKNRGCKLQGSLYGLSHDGCIVFSTKLKPSGKSKLVIVVHLTGCISCQS